MKNSFRANGETQGSKVKLTPVRIVKLVASVILIALTVVFTVKAVAGTLSTPDKFYTKSAGGATFSVFGLSMEPDEEAEGTIEEQIEETFEEYSTVDLYYFSSEYENCFLKKTLTEEQWAEIRDGEGLTTLKNCWIYSDKGPSDEGEAKYFGFENEATEKELVATLRGLNADENNGNYGAAMALFFSAVAIALMFFWHEFFSRYEQIWFLSIIILASIFSIIFPEESCNGINGLVIMLLYLLDTFLNILCELLISKQSKWNFVVSLFVEFTEIAICLVLSYRFATLVSTLFFWIPCDIISFINWHRHPDRKEEELTVVRTLKGWQEAAVLAGIAVFTVVVGWFISGLDITTDLFGGNELMATIVIYLDACATAVGIVNGVFILLRLREQWVAWFACAILEGAINILSGQYVLLVLKAGYLTNSTYGYIRWTKYIKSLGLQPKKKGGKKAKELKAAE